MHRRIYVVLIANEKGGGGKSITAVNLGGEFARRGLRTTLIDADPQATLTRTFVGADHQRMSIGALLQRGQADVAISTIPLDLFLALIVGDREIALIEDGAELSTSLEQIISALTVGTDIVVIDTPGRLGVVLTMALAVADCVVIPTGVGVTGDIAALTTTVDRVERATAPSIPKIILPTDYQRRESPQRYGLDELSRIYGTWLAPAIPHSVRVAAAANAQLTLAQYAPTAPVTQAYAQLAERILAHREVQS